MNIFIYAITPLFLVSSILPHSTRGSTSGRIQVSRLLTLGLLRESKMMLQLLPT